MGNQKQENEFQYSKQGHTVARIYSEDFPHNGSCLHKAPLLNHLIL